MTTTPHSFDSQLIHPSPSNGESYYFLTFASSYQLKTFSFHLSPVIWHLIID
jgi:hypothetical protein